MVCEQLVKKAAITATASGLLLTRWIRIITFNFDHCYQRNKKTNETEAVSTSLNKNIHSFLY